MSSWREIGNKKKEYITWNYRKLNKNNFNRYSAGILPYTQDTNGKVSVFGVNPLAGPSFGISS